MEQTKEIHIGRTEERSFLQIGNETIEVDDYEIKSSANGITELRVTIKGTANVFESSVSLIGSGNRKEVR